MENSTTFMTNPGYCHILDNQIVFAEQEKIQSFTKINSKNSINNVRIKYALLSVLNFIFAFINLKNEQLSDTIFFACLGLVFLTFILFSINKSTTNLIKRNKIKTIIHKKSILGLFGSRFIIFFEDEMGKIKKRLILLPGFYNNGNKETKKALEIMRREKLINF